MKQIVRLSSKLLFSTIALGAFIASCPASNLAQAGNSQPVLDTTQHLVSADAVPKGLTASEWTSIRAAYQANQQQAVRVEGGYRARNPEQQWRTEFDGKGFTTRPEAGDWQWGLELRSYGFAGQQHAVGDGAQVTAQGGSVTYLRDTKLREWFVNNSRGLEHGFTVEQRPAGAKNGETRLEFDLAVRGNLRPAISGDGKTLRFADSQGNAVLTNQA